MPRSHPHGTFALQHVHEFLRDRVPVLGIGLAGQDVDQPEALFATRIQVAVSDPLDRTPLVDNWFNVFGFRDSAFQPWLTPWMRKSV